MEAAKKKDEAKKMTEALKQSALFKTRVEGACSGANDVMSNVAHDRTWKILNSDLLLNPLRTSIAAVNAHKTKHDFWKLWTVLGKRTETSNARTLGNIHLLIDMP